MDIVVVGPCGSGKTTLVSALRERGYAARVVAQEHSVVTELWRHGGKPAALVLLEAEPLTITQRRGADFPEWLYREQQERLASARAEADLRIRTDEATAQEVASQVFTYLRELGLEPYAEPGRTL